ncbi:MAG: hypothetical protein Q6352_008355 [Candidatus Freyrarchaeum guaymaensis]
MSSLDANPDQEFHGEPLEINEERKIDVLVEIVENRTLVYGGLIFKKGIKILDTRGWGRGKPQQKKEKKFMHKNKKP